MKCIILHIIKNIYKFNINLLKKIKLIFKEFLRKIILKKNKN